MQGTPTVVSDAQGKFAYLGWATPDNKTLFLSGGKSVSLTVNGKLFEVRVGDGITVSDPQGRIKTDLKLGAAPCGPGQDRQLPTISLQLPNPVPGLNGKLNVGLIVRDDCALNEQSLQLQIATPNDPGNPIVADLGLGGSALQLINKTVGESGTISLEARWGPLLLSSSGAYTLIVTVKDISGKAQQMERTIQLEEAGPEIPPVPSLPGPPVWQKDKSTPADQEVGVDITKPIELCFNEPVVIPISPSPLMEGDQAIPVVIEAVPGIACYRLVPLIGESLAGVVPLVTRLLNFKTGYTIRLTDQVKDSDNSALSNPGSLTFTTRLLEPEGEGIRNPLDRRAIAVSEDGAMLAISEGFVANARIRLFDISSPTFPVEQAIQETAPSFRATALRFSGNRLYASGNWTFFTGYGSALAPMLKVFDLPSLTPIDQLLLTELFVMGIAQGMEVIGGMVYVLTLDDLRVIDVERMLQCRHDFFNNGLIDLRTFRDCRKGSIVSIQPLLFGTRIAKLGEDRIAVLTRSELLLFDASTPSSPVQVGKLAVANPFRIELAGGVTLSTGEQRDYAMIKGQLQLSVVDVTNWSAPKLLHTLSKDANNIVVDPGKRILFLQGAEGVIAVDLLPLVEQGKIHQLNAAPLPFSTGPIIATANHLWAMANGENEQALRYAGGGEETFL